MVGDGRPMRIALEARNESSHPAYWVDGRQRLATCTSVRIIDDRRLVCASLVGQALYLIEFNKQLGTHRVLDRVSTVCAGAPVCTDLLDFDGCDLLATSNCEDSSASFYRLTGDRIRHQSDVRIDGSDSGFCHGVAFAPGTAMVCAAIQSGAETFQLWSRNSSAVLARIADPGWKPKDSVFISPHRMLAAYSGRAGQQGSKNTNGSKLALIEFADDFRSHEALREWPLDTGQVDSISYSKGDVFVSDQGRDQVHRFRLDGDLHQVESFSGYEFPHGIHYHAPSGLLAVTNYATNSVDLRHVG